MSERRADVSEPRLGSPTEVIPGAPVPLGNGDDLDVAAGRCCPTCRHDLTPHNTAVWNAGYSVATRHSQDYIREAWDEGYRAAYADERENTPDATKNRHKGSAA